jgi:GT2 family glycosyltransferase
VSGATSSPHYSDVAICVATFRRAEGLRRLIKRLGEPGVTPGNLKARVIVVNNDATDERPRDVCDDGRRESSMEIEYVVEPRRGISFARNAALDAAARADWVAFIDDDEAPQAGWLKAMIAAQELYGADVVAGPVVSEFEQSPPAWVLRGKFFDRPRYQTGRVLNRAFTNNALVRMELVRGSGVRFDARFGTTGGEDVKFFRELAARGARIVWADDAVVTEFVPADRVSAEWLVQRMYRIGTVTSVLARDAHDGPVTTVLQSAKAAVWTLIGLLHVVCSAAGGMAMRVRGRRCMAYGRGLLAGLAGRSVAGYGDAPNVEAATNPGQSPAG